MKHSSSKIMSKHILLVDDEIEIVNFLSRFLKRFKVPTIKATSGKEALRIYSKKHINFVFLDIQMPDIDGLSVLREIKAMDPRAKVIMITGKTDTAYQSKAKELGAIDYITKPLNLADLKEKIDKYILQE